MLVSFEYDGKIIANAELSKIPDRCECVTIWGKTYHVNNVKHEVEIKQKSTGKKVVVEKNICTLCEE